MPTPVKYDASGLSEFDNYKGLGWWARHKWAEDPLAPHEFGEMYVSAEGKCLRLTKEQHAELSKTVELKAVTGWVKQPDRARVIATMYPTPIKSDATVSKTDYVLKSVEDGKAFNRLAREVHKRERIKARTWPTPLKADVKGAEFGLGAIEAHALRRGRSEAGDMLSHRVKVRQKAQWSTPTATQPVMPQATLEARMVDPIHKGNTSVPLVEALQREAFAAAGPGPVEYGELNPYWVEWLMGWPFGWTSIEPMPRAAYELWEQMIAGGTWWLADPSEDPDSGITKSVPKERHPFREHQIAALGNGQVSAVCAAQFAYLMTTPDLQPVPEDYPE